MVDRRTFVLQPLAYLSIIHTGAIWSLWNAEML